MLSLVLVPNANNELSPRDFNVVIKRPHYSMPIIEDVITDIANAKIFTIIDVKHGFW